MALFRGIQEYIALDANNITLVFDSGNIVDISGNILYPILYKYRILSHVCLSISTLSFRGSAHLNEDCKKTANMPVFKEEGKAQ